MHISRGIHSVRDRVRHRISRCSADSGMSTAEYAVGTVAACGFGGVLYKVVTSTSVAAALADLINRALTSAF